MVWYGTVGCGVVCMFFLSIILCKNVYIYIYKKKAYV
jgi:hypothetical protein